jgi:23S rRNA pseudouridine1911/1915/1917 synthase
MLLTEAPEDRQMEKPNTNSIHLGWFCYDVPMIHTWTAAEKDTGLRLDLFLVNHLPQSRNQIVKLLKLGRGKINGKKATAHSLVSYQDTIIFDETAEIAPAITESDAKVHIPKVTVIEKTDSYFIINKPAGLLVHPDGRSKGPTLVDAMLALDPKIARVGEEPSRPGIMHRLDKDVSGLMVIARTQAAYDSLKQQFAAHSLTKRYLAVVYGTVTQEEGDLKFRIARSTTKGRMAARPVDADTGRAAWTHYKTLQRFHHASLLELDILSGRTHQIRSHLLAFNHPVIGDPLYKRQHEDRSIKAPRLMLQSIYLSFLDPETNEQKTYTLPPDPAFATVLSLLK